MNESIPSVSTFTDPSVVAPVDPDHNPTQAVYYWLLRDIIRGVFEPLERLKVEQIVAFYKIGHSPVREAILLLSATGLVVHEHQKGHRVAPVSLAEYRDLISVYRRIYRLTLEMALENGDDAWEEAVVVQLHRSLKVPKLFDSPEHREMWQRAYGNLHHTLLSGCGSPLMVRLWTDLGFRLERYTHLFADRDVDLKLDHHSMHREIVDALVQRDAARLEQLVSELFAMGEGFHKSIAAALAAKESRPAAASPAEGEAPRKRGRPRKIAAQ
ncbi:GntR family transcriptional regulator [Sphingomonas cannabina]|uniref:GntR family transcriptional regulator n=1 Tax=Sphingomonas cannabina TaxID=2899123 RepID=UPI001F1D54AC|nr:GntR family transcriptional regulator [Sphingomonas cannabina]UIJ44251.1 GntR family transcriptional regulator [Sphingomonas cannabina]